MLPFSPSSPETGESVLSLYVSKQLVSWGGQAFCRWAAGKNQNKQFLGRLYRLHLQRVSRPDRIKL